MRMLRGCYPTCPRYTKTMMEPGWFTIGLCPHRVPLVGILQLNSLPFPGTLGVELFYMSCSVILRGDNFDSYGQSKVSINKAWRREIMGSLS